MKTNLLISLMCLIGIASAAKWNITVSCQKCTISCGKENCFLLTTDSFLSAISYNEQVCGDISCNLGIKYNLEVDRCENNGFRESCSSKVCIYQEAKDSCARYISYVTPQQCQSTTLNVSCGSCKTKSCNQCMFKNSVQDCSTESCGGFENKNLTIYLCNNAKDVTGNYCDCCMSVNPANKLGVCTSNTDIFKSNKFTAYALARSILSERSIIMSLIVVLGLLGVLF